MIVFGLSTPNFLLFDEVQWQCLFVVVIGSSYCRRPKSPPGTVLIINLHGKGLTPRACMGGGGSIWSQGPEIALQFRYTFYGPQTKRLRARKIGLQYKIRKGRKQIWGRFSNPWNSNGIEWNRLILLTWSRILMYLPNTVGKRHKKAFKFIFGDRNLRLRDSAFVRCAPQQMVTEMT